MRTTYAATGHILLARNISKLRLRPSSDCKRILVYLEPRELVWWLQMSSYFV